MANLKVFFHDNCFDGAASAALFTHYFRECQRKNATVDYVGMQHKAAPFANAVFDAESHACVDFRYCEDPRMQWWFDHHISAFQPPELREQFEATRTANQFYDPEAKSCTKFIAESLRERDQFEPSGAWPELIAWADLIDSAQFPSAQMAVELREPALHIMTWLESNDDAAATHRLISELGVRPLGEIAAEKYIQDRLAPRLLEHQKHIAIISERARDNGSGVVTFDLVDDNVGAHNKFIAYMLFPEARYTVGVTRQRDRVKISVGSNPWSKILRNHNIAAICEGYGGGGHPVVGAVSVPGQDVDKARRIAQEIVAALSK